MKKKIVFLLLSVFFLFGMKSVYAEERKVYMDEKIGTFARDSFGNIKYDECYSFGNVLIDNGVSYSTLNNDIHKIIFNDVSRSGVTYASFDSSFDISRDKDESVILAIMGDTLYIQFNGTLYLNEKSNGLFLQFLNVETIVGLEFLDTSQVKEMQAMFENLEKVKSLDLSSFDTSNVVDMNSMFADCEELETLDLSIFNTSKVTNMSFMFQNCKKLTYLDFSNADTSNVTNMEYMFYNTGFVDFSMPSFNTSKVQYMHCMFENCNNLETLDLTNFDTSHVVYIQGIFANSKKIKKIYVSNLWNLSSLNNPDDWCFNDNNELVGEYHLLYDYKTQHNKCSYAQIGGINHDGLLSIKGGVSSDVYEFYNYVYPGERIAVYEKPFDLSNLIVDNVTVNYNQENNHLYVYYGDLLIHDYYVEKHIIDLSVVGKKRFKVSDEYQFTYKVNPEDWNTGEIRDVKWYSSNPDVFEIDIDTGFGRAKSNGTANIYFSSNYASNPLSITVSDVIRGDLSNDGEVTFTDVIVGLRKVFGYVPKVENDILVGDLNENGDLDFSDIIILLRYVFGYITEI